ncbi:MAG: restriction endonuclease [Clostridia bacterium]|nr:restriction endonuclease [Clostridia bacterium]MBO5256646.1 restriction endonuclease [Clostridia bacterium]MBP3293440.1 restriction endonuclease [Clostridia bacterium]MBQ7312544.1 restriction endonuclease [Clostridia bacterium]
MEQYEKYIHKNLMDKFEFQNYGHALEILNEAYPEEWEEIQNCLEQLVISVEDIKAAGGNETAIPKKFDDVLYPLGWREIRITGDLLVKLYPRRANQRGRFSDEPYDEKVIEGYIDGHNIDFIKDKVAFDLEWNSKDQTFDRDLLAMRTYFDCGLIEVGIIVTRSKDLNDIFKEITDEKGRALISKYGASTTWMGKLEYRLKSRRNGGCPILAVGIKKPCVEGYEYNGES